MANQQTWTQKIVALVSIGAVAFLCGERAEGAPPTDRELPQELREWIPWVMADVGSDLCTLVQTERRCVWPGSLELSLKEGGAEFVLTTEAETTATHTLPGSPLHFPIEVKVDGKAVVVLRQGDVPVVELAPGSHEIRGRFEWTTPPETLPVGPETAFVTVLVTGKRATSLRRDSAGVWLSAAANQKSSASTEDPTSGWKLRVHRQIQDGMPLIVDTHLAFDVSESPGEVRLPLPLLSGTIPLDLVGDLAASYQKDGTLRVQLLPGQHELHLTARALGVPTTLTVPALPTPWPGQEIWTFVPAPEYRVVNLEGLSAIDVSRTDLPAGWREHGAFLTEPGQNLSLTTSRRGEEQLPPNQLSLHREFWLDENGDGITAVDTFSGTLHQGFRLNLTEGTLGSARAAERPQLLTLQGNLRGVEVRESAVRLTTVSRLPAARSLKAVGWDQDVDALSADLHLPPGWSLFSASGVDSTSDAWVQRWDLFDIFYVVIVAFTMWKLVGGWGLAAALLGLILSRGEEGAPEYFWLPLVMLIALGRALKPSVLRNWVLFLSRLAALGLVISLLLFSIDQIRAALYPHLRAEYRSVENFMAGQAELEATEAAAPPAPASASDSDMKEGGSGVRSKAAPLVQRKVVQAPPEIRPDALIQTGPGVPEVTGNSLHLAWSGPVLQEQPMSWIVVPPWANRGLTVLRLASLAALAWLLYRLHRQGPTEVPQSSADASPGSAGITAISLFASLMLAPHLARAEPSDARLAELRQRLTAAPKCGTECLHVPRLALAVGKKLEARAEVHAGARVAYRLPGSAAGISSWSIRVDGQPLKGARLEADGYFYLRLEPGVHRVDLEAPLPRGRFQLELGERPENVRVTSEGYLVSGVNADGSVPGGMLTIEPQLVAQEDGSTTSELTISGPPSFRITRHFVVGLRGSVHTHLERLSALGTPEQIGFALLPGERVLTPQVRVASGVATVDFARDVAALDIESQFDAPEAGRTLEWNVTAPDPNGPTHLWKLECTELVHCDARGLPPIRHVENGRALWTFAPHPGESLHVRAESPAAAPGDTVTIHRAQLEWTPGMRASDASLTLRVETTHSAPLHITLPDDARPRSLQVDGTELPTKLAAGKVAVALEPGTHEVTLNWQSGASLSPWYHPPVVHAGSKGVSFRTVINLPDNRWLLWGRGPSQGPALLFWGYLILIGIVAILLGRTPLSPLRIRDWLLLGLGLTQIPVAAALLIVGWFFAVVSRKTWRETQGRRRNLLQVALCLYSIVFLATLFGAVYGGLVVDPDMQVVGAGSSAQHLVWFVDRSPGDLPTPAIFSLSIWFWRGAMLAWSLWLARKVLIWVKWAWEELQVSGFWAAPRPVALAGSPSADVAASGADAGQGDGSPNDTKSPTSTEN